MTKIAWVCDTCDWLQVSDSKRRHEMDQCMCKKDRSAVDLEEGYCRFLGSPRFIAKKEDGDKWRHVRHRKKK